MKKLTQTFLSVGAVLIISSIFQAHAESKDTATASDSKSLRDRVNISGFGRLVGGFVDTEEAEFQGYDDEFSISEESLIAIQLDANITDSISFAAQLLGHMSDSRSSGVEWAYFTYSPNRSFTIRAGRQRSPFNAYSDVLDVGYAYHYTSPPIQVYNNLFTNYDGVNVRYQTGIRDFLFSVEGYWGSYDEPLVYTGISLEPNVNDLRGMIFELQYGGYTGRVSRIEGDVNLQIPGINPVQQQLAALNFSAQAAALAGKGPIDINQANFSYKGLDWFAEVEAMEISADLLFVPKITSWLMSAGVHIGKATLYTYVSDSDAQYSEVPNTIPLGIDPGLDQLAFAYDAIISERAVDNLRSYSIGVRYDLPYNMAIKFSATKLDGEAGARSFFTHIKQPEFDRQATLYQVALEWVF